MPLADRPGGRALNLWALLWGAWLLPLVGIDIERILDYMEDPGEYHDR